MYPLLSREEINALLHETGEPTRTSPRQFIIELGEHCILLQGLFSLEQDCLIELNVSLDKSYVIRSQDKNVAHGALIALDKRLVLKITKPIDCNNCSIME
jgi:flagellar motor switch/type III secretory pathway protein FliN